MPIAPIVVSIALSALSAGVCWGIAWRFWDRSGGPIAGGEWSGAPALAVACIAGSGAAWTMWGWPGFPPRVAEGWLPFIAAAALVLGWIESRLRPRHPSRFALWGALAVFAVVSTLGSRRAAWSVGESLLWQVPLAVGAGVLLGVLEFAASRRPGASWPLAAWIWSAGVAGALAATGSVKYGQLAGLTAAALGAGVVLAAWKPSMSFARGPASVIVPWNGALLIAGYFYSDLPAAAALLLAAAPLALWVGESDAVTRRPPGKAAAIRLTLIGIPVAAALLIAAWHDLFPAATSTYNY